MISYLKGAILAKGPEHIILLAGNVGYKLFVGDKALALLKEGQEAEFFCHLHVKREDTIELYGVSSFSALLLFESLRGVSGIGPKAALAISSLGSAESLRKAIMAGDEAFFNGVHGIGKKKIQKIILELAGKLVELKSNPGKETSEEISALVSLGFSQGEARDALAKVSNAIIVLEDRIKEALKFLGNR